MKKIKSYKQFNELDFKNEELNWKTLLPSLAIMASLNLSSCKTKDDFENKIPEIEILVKNQIDILNDENSNYGIQMNQNDTVIVNNTEVRGPFENTKEEFNNIYYIVSDLTTITTIGRKNHYYIIVYQENKETKKGLVFATKSTDSKKELEDNIEWFKKFGEWKNVVDEDNIKISIENAISNLNNNKKFTESIQLRRIISIFPGGFSENGKVMKGQPLLQGPLKTFDGKDVLNYFVVTEVDELIDNQKIKTYMVFGWGYSLRHETNKVIGYTPTLKNPNDFLNGTDNIPFFTDGYLDSPDSRER